MGQVTLATSLGKGQQKPMSQKAEGTVEEEGALSPEKLQSLTPFQGMKTCGLTYDPKGNGGEVYSRENAETSKGGEPLTQSPFESSERGPVSIRERK